MIRAALVSIVFLGLTLTLILMQPSGGNDPYVLRTPDEDSVARAQTEFDALAVVPDTRAVHMVSPTSAGEPDATPVAVAADTMSQATAALAVPQAATSQYAAPDTQLEQLIVSALKQGQTPNYIDALVNDAASKGTVEVPLSLITEDGKVDTGSLLAVLSTPVRKTTKTAASARSYVVQTGDNLASISYRYYGTTGRAAEIFSANRSVLGSPDHVEVGQTLVIPAP